MNAFRSTSHSNAVGRSFASGRAAAVGVFVLACFFLLAPQRLNAASVAASSATQETAQPAAQPEHEGGSPERQLSEASKESTEEHHPSRLFGRVVAGWVVQVLRWLNFVLLFGILGWFIRKPLAQFFQQRTESITEGMRSGRKAREEANARLAQIESRLNGLDSEIARLRAQSASEAETERARLRQNAEAEAAKILAMAQQEIEAAAKAAQMELKQFAASLAVEGAERQIRARMKPAVQDQLLKDYAATLQKQGVQSRRA